MLEDRIEVGNYTGFTQYIGLKTYLFSYTHAGARYSLEIPAYSEEEADGRVASISATAHRDGVLVSVFKPSLLGRIFARLRRSVLVSIIKPSLLDRVFARLRELTGGDVA